MTIYFGRFDSEMSDLKKTHTKRACLNQIRDIKYRHKYFRFFGKELSISRFESWERPCYFTFYRGIHEFLNSYTFEKITVLKIYAVDSISQNT